MNKKGAVGMYEVIRGLIISLMVMMILLFGVTNLFAEYFDADGHSREACWQSVQVRSIAPEVKGAGFRWKEFKSILPLKCKTRVVEVSEADVRDVTKAQVKIADAMAECWALYGEGDLNAFPAKAYGASSTCVPCARIHLTDDAKEYMRESEGEVKISIVEGLDEMLRGDLSYYAYLENSGKRFPALNPASSGKFDLKGENFGIEGGGKGKRHVNVYIREGGKFEVGVSTPLTEPMFSIDEFSEMDGLNYDLKQIVLKINKIEPSAEGIVSEFCKGKDFDKKCSAVEEYIKSLGSGVIVNIREDGENGWAVGIWIRDEDQVVGVFINKFTGKVYDGNVAGGLLSIVDISKMRLPEFMDVENGDLLINYGVITSSKEFNIGDYIPYLFYFQVEQSSSPFEEVKKQFINGILWENAAFCEGWEGVSG